MSAGRPSYDELAALVAEQATRLERQDAVIAGLQAENRDLRQQLGDLNEKLRAASRQAAPFRRRATKTKPDGEKKKPGRAAGHEGSYRRPPPEIDHHQRVDLTHCPHCQGDVTNVTGCVQIIEEIPPVRPIVTELTTYTGNCARCGDVRSTHPLQTSTATGAAGTHLGPRATAVAVALSHQAGLTMRRVCRMLKTLCGLSLTPGGLAQLLQRASRRVETPYTQIVETIRHSAAVFADETSWYVGKPNWWLWTFTTPAATLYKVDSRRSAAVVIETLTESFAGMLVSDCLSAYNPPNYKKHKCIAHHLRALSDHQETLAKRDVESYDLYLWKTHLQQVIQAWRDRPRLTESAYQDLVDRHTRGVEGLLSRAPPEPEAEKFRLRMGRQREHLLGCLHEPAAEPTNNRAERALRPAVIDRKLSCGNKTVAGKTAWERLRSVVVTLAGGETELVDALSPHFRLAAPQPATR